MARGGELLRQVVAQPQPGGYGECGGGGGAAAAAVTAIPSDWNLPRAGSCGIAATTAAAGRGGGGGGSSGGNGGWRQQSSDTTYGRGPARATGTASAGGADGDEGDARASDCPSPPPRTPTEPGDREAGGETAPPTSGTEGDEPPPSLGVRAALAMLAFYRGVLSPLMPSTCRFLPTCSVYSIESYKKFGVARGSVLTAWRLLRCNPWGGSGYDPPAWPPVGLGAIYRYPYTPEISVVLGAAAAYWLVASTLESLVH